ncbi:Oidioi.mRNA.OKI2018_I69.XSR.g16778.t1.cds [Oikopleura dioica]|uniref:rhomboid protease n=1 Tax=Oikopleura dioica TaxID=34765 RepID=A0ABN7SL35_OIKDI|nr:Oidioi.mRNA.OKI2018_I69.XSR.g16778.t1.cds [Oikopleura dioica]
MAEYEAGKPADEEEPACCDCCISCENKMISLLDDLGIKSKKHVLHATDPAYNKTMDPCDLTCRNDTDGNFPYFTLIMSAIHIGFYIYFVATDPTHNIAGFNKNILCSPFIYSPYHREEVWRFFTYSFTHSGICHITFNLLFQIGIGSLLEMVHGSWDVIRIYGAGALAGGLTAGIISPGKLLVGASGGDYALIFGYLGNMILNWDSMKNPFTKYMRLIFLLLFIGSDLFNAIFGSLASSGVSCGAHLGGAIVGLGVSMACLKNFNSDNDWEKNASYVLMALSGGFVLFALGWQIFSPTFDKYDEVNPPCYLFSKCEQYATNCSSFSNL